MDLTRTHVLLADGAAMKRLAEQPLQSSVDRERLSQIRVPGGRKRFVVGRALVARLFDLAGAPRGTHVRADARGCPRVEPPTDLAVSISHTRSWVAAAVTFGARCGVDVQDRIDPMLFRPATLAAVLPAGWTAQLTAHPEPATELTRMWVVLEAALKWRGTGFTAPVSELRFTSVGDSVWVVELSSGRSTRIDVWALPDGAMVAVTVDSSGGATILHTTPEGADPYVSKPGVACPLLSSTKGRPCLQHSLASP